MSLINSKVQSRQDWETMLQNHQWVPFSEVKPTDLGFDWVLVQFVEKKSGFVGIPCIAEYSKTTNKWSLPDFNQTFQEYFNTDCYASSWKIIEYSPEWLERNAS